MSGRDYHTFIFFLLRDGKAAPGCDVGHVRRPLTTLPWAVPISSALTGTTVAFHFKHGYCLYFYLFF